MGNFFCIPRKTKVTPEEQLACLELKVSRMKMKLSVYTYKDVKLAWKPSEYSQCELRSFRDSILSHIMEEIESQESSSIDMNYWNN